MMNISNQLLCLFSGQIERRDGSYVIEVPEQELNLGAVAESETYRVAMLPHESASRTQLQTEPEPEPDQERGPRSPPVDEGERREVEIEDIGDQGDGITRVERGYVVIVPDTEKGERVTIEITDVQQNVSFAEVIERQTHFR